MNKLILAVAALATSASVSAATRTFSLTDDFGSSVFQYGTVTSTGTGNVFSTFTPSDCSNIGVPGLCYRGTDTYQVEFKRDASNLVVHPGPNDGQNSFLLFVAPRTGVYTYNVTVSRGDTGDGVNLFTYNSADGSKPFITTINANNPSQTFQYDQFLTIGQKVGLGIDRGGPNNNYFGDSTFVGGTITGAVPEPASWALMLGGFAFAGTSVRRRRNAVRITYA
jgi:hypothetical protein